jgi:hypothetical protein
MLSLSTARRLKAAGLAWTPGLHDFFAIPDRGLDDRVFVISDVSVDIELLKGQSIVTFNGTSEWAMDYEVMSEVVWMPTEEQLRQQLEQRLAPGSPALKLTRAPPFTTRKCVASPNVFLFMGSPQECARALLRKLRSRRPRERRATCLSIESDTNNHRVHGST